MRDVMILVAALAACGDNLQSGTDARPIDSLPADASVDGPCAMGRYVTGELVDIDSTTTSLAGINSAVLTQRGGAATDTTSPNGRFELCVSGTTTFLFDVDAPSTHVDGIAYFENEAASGGFRPASFRTWTPARAQTFFTSLGLTYDPAKAHVLIHMVSDTAGMTMSGGSHGAPQRAIDPSNSGAFTWAGGADGRYVLFPNVDPAAGMVTLIGDTSGQHDVPVAAGKITLAALSIVYL